METNLPVLLIHGQFVSLFLDKGDKNVKNSMTEAIMYSVNFSFMYITAITLNCLNVYHQYCSAIPSPCGDEPDPIQLHVTMFVNDSRLFDDFRDLNVMP